MLFSPNRVRCAEVWAFQDNACPIVTALSPPRISMLTGGKYSPRFTNATGLRYLLGEN